MDTHGGSDFRRQPRFSCLSRCAAALTTLGRPPPVVLTLFSSRPTILSRAPYARALALRRPFGPLPPFMLYVPIEWGKQILNLRLCCRCHRESLSSSYITCRNAVRRTLDSKLQRKSRL